MEFWISRGGWLREWIRLNLLIGVVLMVAALLIVPPITILLEGIRDWSDLMTASVGNVSLAVTTLPPIVLALAAGFLIVKLIQRYRAKRHRQERHPYSHYD